MKNDFTKQDAIRAISRYLYNVVCTSESHEACDQTATQIINLPQVITWAESWGQVAVDQELDQ